MAKRKRREFKPAKKNLADEVRASKKKKPVTVKSNPFEVKINRQKHDVIGRRVSKYEKGMPGFSRQRANMKREQSLMPEINKLKKSNVFVDKRFGEYDTNLTMEDKMLKRYAMIRAGEKTNKFNLNEDEDELTHYGQSLAEIEKFEDPVISDEDDDDDENQGRISGEMVSREHFGGFLENSNFEPLGGDKRTWKERMEEVIANSKKAKHERQMEKEKNQELTDKLDSEFSDLLKFMSTQKRNKQDTSRDKQDTPMKSDDFDVTVRELKFEAKGQATNKLKTDEEIAKEEKEKLEKMEADRMRRMRGETDEEQVPSTYRSADDLDDGFALDTSGGYFVSYKDGKLATPSPHDTARKEGKDYESEEDESDEENNEEEGDNEDGNSIDEDADDDNEDVDMEDDEDDSADDEDDDDESDGEDSYEDIQSDKEEEEPQKTEKPKASKMNLLDRKKLMEAAREELPYTFTMPESYDSLLDLLQSYSEERQITVIERICKCYHPSLAENNKEKLHMFFGFLIQYYGDLALQEPPGLQLMDKLTTPLYKMTSQSPVEAGKTILEQIIERQEEFKEICSRKAGRGLYPALDSLLLLKLVSVLFPTSDFHHHVTTPTLLFIAQMLAQCPVNHERDVAAGLFLCNLCLEFVSMSKRFIPEAINFLHGVLFLAAIKDPKKVEKVVPPFRPVGETIDLLRVHKKQKNVPVENFKMSEVLSITMEVTNPNQFRISAVHHCVSLLQEFSLLYKDLVSYKEIFSPVRCMCDKLPVDKYPKSLQDKVCQLSEDIDTKSNVSKRPVVMKSLKPTALKMFEPLVEEVLWDRKGKKSKGLSKEKAEKQKLVHKYKKELKGAMREIRLDSKFIARKKLQKTLENDRERAKKVRKLKGMLGVQEGEFNNKKHKNIAIF